MWWWSAPSGATKAKARSSTGSPPGADVVVRFQGGNNAGHTIVIAATRLQVLAAALRHGAGQALGHRQRRRGRSLGADRGDRARARPGAGHRQPTSCSPTTRRWCCRCTATWIAHAKNARARTRSAPPRAASAPPMRTRSAAGRSASSISPTRRPLTPSSSACSPITNRCARVSACRRSPPPTPRG